MRPVEQDINPRVATEHSVDLLWAGSVICGCRPRSVAMRAATWPSDVVRSHVDRMCMRPLTTAS
jgi:hypothetical protein